MKQIIFNKLKWLLVPLVLIALGTGYAWGTDLTFNSFSGLGSSSYPSGSTTSTPITLASTGWYGASATELRIKSGATVTISCTSSYKITKIVFTATGTTRANLNDPVVWSGTTGTYTNASGTTSVTFSNSAQCRFSKIVVTYSAAASCTTSPTVTAASNSSITSTTATVSCSSGISSLGSAGCSISSYGFVIGTSSNPSIGGSGVTQHEVGTSYTVTGTSFSKNLTGLSASTTYYVRPYATNGNGTGYGTQTSFSTPALPTYTVTYNAGTGTCGTSSWTQGSYGASTSLPSATAPATCSGWSFAGWCTTSAGSAEDNPTSPGTILTSGSSYTPTENITLYAVYTKSGGGSGRDEGYYVTRSLSAGKTYIFGAVRAAASSTLANDTQFGAIAFTNTYNATTPNWGPRVDLTPNSSGYIAADNASITAACIWTLQSISSGNYTFKNGSNYIYLGDAVGSTSAGAQCGVSTSAGKMYMDDVNGTCKDAFMLYNTSEKDDKLMVYNTGSSGYRMYNKSDRDGKHSATMTPYVRFYEYDPGTTTYYMTSLVCCSDPGLAYGTASVTKTFGNDPFTNTLTNSHSVSVTYALSSVSPAGCVEINASSGQVTINGAGSATVTASFAGNATYCADEASYTLTVNKANISPTLTYSPNSVAVGENSATPTVGGNTGSGTVTYAITSASPAGCASINTSTGVVTGVAVGSVTVTATVGATANYNGNTATATVTITAATNFPNNKTIFIQAHSTSAWTGGGCVKAWFHSYGGSETAQPTYWLFDAGSPDEGKKLFAAIVPASGNLPYLDIQRFAANCNDWWNKNGGCSYADADESNAVRSTGKNDDASDGDFIRWNDDAVTLSLYGDPNTWGGPLASFSDQGNGVWTATYSNYAPANAAGESQEFKICTNYNGWIGNTGSNNNVTVSDMHVGSTYNIGASLDIKDHSLTLTKTFVKGTVHFNMKGHGSAISDLTNVAAGSKISAPSPAPTADGYRFVGWYKEDACTNAWNFGSDVVNETMTLYAKWVQTFTVTYDANGGTGTITDSSSPYDTGSTVTVKNSTGFTAPTGKEFDHWNTAANNSGASYNPSGTFTISANTTLYAQWRDINYTVTMAQSPAAGAELTGGTTTAHYNGTINISTTVPDGYRFNGWTASPSVTFASASSTSTSFTMPANNVTVTANFVQTHTVSWKSNGADYVSPVTYDHGTALVLPVGTPSAPAGCSSKTFVGWTSDDEITVATSTRPTIISAGGAVNANATYRAVFADRVGGSGDVTFTSASSWAHTGTNSSGGQMDITGSGVTVSSSKGYVNTGSSRMHIYGSGSTMVVSVASGKITKIEVLHEDGSGNYSGDKWMAGEPGGTEYSVNSSTKISTWQKAAGETSVTYTTGAQVRFTNIKIYYTTLVDDNYITLCSSCTTPSGLEVSSITSTGGTVSWDGVSAVAEIGGSGTGFTVLWGTDPVRANNSNTANVAAGTNEYGITGLTPATRYYVWVQSKCNDEWSSSADFYTNAKITYAAGTGASGSMTPKEVTYNTNASVDPCTFTAPSGKTFNGWVSNVAVHVNGGGSTTTTVPAEATINNLTAAITLTAQWRDLAVYHVTFSADNGTVAGGTNQNVLEGGTLTFPNVTSTTCGTFSGWVEAAYDNTTAPSGATYHAVGDELAADPSMDGKTYYAVYHVATGAPTTINDVITYADLAATSVVYAEFDDVSKSSSAVYKGETAKNGTNDIQLRSSGSTSGIVSKASGGLVKKVTFVWGTGNTSGRTVDIYGKNSAYTAASDLYGDAASKGTSLGSIVEGTSTEVTISGDYEYVGIRSNSGAAYIASITIQWYGSPMKYQTSPGCSPVISMTSSFSSFTYVYGSGPSASQSFTVSGANLGANLVVTAPTNYEVCKTSGGTYTSSVSYTPSDGTVTDQTVYIRLAGGLNVGTYNYAAASGVSAASTGATTRTAALTGSVTKAAGAIAFTDFNAVDHYEAEMAAGASSVDVTLTVSVTGDGAVSYSRSPTAGSSAVPATMPTTTLHVTTVGTWTVTANLAAGTNYTSASTNCQVVVYYADRFYDNLHGNSTIVKRNDVGEDHYTIPSLSDESRQTSGTCSQTHYHFMGWVPEAALGSLTDDASYTAVMITGGGTQAASGTNYYAVWAEE